MDYLSYFFQFLLFFIFLFEHKYKVNILQKYPSYFFFIITQCYLRNIIHIITILFWYFIFRSVKKNKKFKKDNDFDKNIKPLKKTITKKKQAKELNKILKAKVKTLQLKDTSTKDDIFNKDLWAGHRGIFKICDIKIIFKKL